MVENKLYYNPDFAIHPGESLKDELDFIGLKQIELSERTGLSEKHISQIINTESPITPETAIKLERAIGVPAVFWNNLQKNYELTRARIASEEKVEQEIKEAKKFICYSELVGLKCVEKSNDWKKRTENLLKFFGVDSLFYVQTTEAIAFRQAQGKFNSYSLAAWLRCGELDAKKHEIRDYNRKTAVELAPKIRELTLLPGGFGEQLKDLCASAGIAIVYTPYFKNTKVNGSARWMGNNPVIQLNTRGAFSDIFWFTFFHELGHILLHGVKDKFIDYNGKNKDKKEKEADAFATETLVSQNEYDNFLKTGPLTREGVIRFASSIGISASIIFGRLAHEGKADWSKIASLRNRLIINSSE